MDVDGGEFVVAEPLVDEDDDEEENEEEEEDEDEEEEEDDEEEDEVGEEGAGDEQQDGNVLDGGMVEPRDDNSSTPNNPAQPDILLFFKCSEALDGFPNHPVLRVGVTVQIGLEKSTKLEAVFQRYVAFCNEHAAATAAKSNPPAPVHQLLTLQDVEFVHCQLLNPNDTPEAAALMKNDQITVRRERSSEREIEAEKQRLQRESDREFFHQMRKLVPPPGYHASTTSSAANSSSSSSLQINAGSPVVTEQVVKGILLRQQQPPLPPGRKVGIRNRHALRGERRHYPHLGPQSVVSEVAAANDNAATARRAQVHGARTTLVAVKQEETHASTAAAADNTKNDNHTLYDLADVILDCRGSLAVLPTVSDSGNIGCSASTSETGALEEGSSSGAPLAHRQVPCFAVIVKKRCPWLGGLIYEAATARDQRLRELEQRQTGRVDSSTLNSRGQRQAQQDRLEEFNSVERQQNQKPERQQDNEKSDAAAAAEFDEDGNETTQAGQVGHGREDKKNRRMDDTAAQIENDDDEEQQMGEQRPSYPAALSASSSMDREDSGNLERRDSHLWVVLDYAPEAVRILLEYCYTNRVVQLGHEAFVQSCLTKPGNKNRLQGPVPPHPHNNRRWPNRGEPTVSFNVILAALSLAEDAGLKRLSLACEVAAAQLVTFRNAVDALTLCEVLRDRADNPLPRLRKSAMDVILRWGPPKVPALKDQSARIIPTLLAGAVEAVDALEKKRKHGSGGTNHHNHGRASGVHAGEKRDWRAMAYEHFEHLDEEDNREREQERRKRRFERMPEVPPELHGNDFLRSMSQNDSQQQHDQLYERGVNPAAGAVTAEVVGSSSHQHQCMGHGYNNNGNRLKRRMMALEKASMQRMAGHGRAFDLAQRAPQPMELWSSSLAAAAGSNPNNASNQNRRNRRMTRK